MEQGKNLTEEKAKCFQFTSPKPKLNAKPGKAKAVSKPPRKPRMIRCNSEDVFNPEGPKRYDFSEQELKDLVEVSHDKVVPVQHDHEWGHLTETCGCLFNDAKNRRLIGCDKLILQDRFREAELEEKPYSAMDKLLKIAEALDARQYLYPKDANQKAQLLTLWSFAYEVSTGAIAALTDTDVPNY